MANEQTPQAQQQPSEVETQLAVIEKEVGNIPAVFKGLLDRSQRACLALSKVQAIEDDETDRIANDLLVKARVTLEGKPEKDGAPSVLGLVDTRMQLTKPLDNFKRILMQPEKDIQAQSERLQGLRNGYAKKKLLEQQAREKEIALQKQKDDEVARVRAAMKEGAITALIGLINSVSSSIAEHVATMNLDNWEIKLARFDIKPSLRPEKYAGLFTVQYDANLMTADMYKAIQAQVQAEPEYTIEKLGEEYVSRAEATIKLWKDDLPKKKEELERLRQLEETDRVAAEKERERLASENQKTQQQAQERTQAWGAGMQQAVEKEKDEALLKNEFTAQIATQEGAAATPGVRTARVAVINCPDADIVKTISQVLYACYSNPKFKGHMKRDRKGIVLPPDEDGNPQYAEWLATLLDFVAKEFPGDKLEGIIFKPKVTTVAKA